MNEFYVGPPAKIRSRDWPHPHWRGCHSQTLWKNIISWRKKQNEKRHQLRILFSKRIIANLPNTHPFLISIKQLIYYNLLLIKCNKGD